MIVKNIRIEKGWSQEQLATMSGVSTRTIQRIEKGKKAGFESLKSIAAVLEIELKDFNIGSDIKEIQMQSEAKVKRPFIRSLSLYLIVNSLLLLLNLYNSPDYLWAKWPAMGWGLALFLRLLLKR